MCVCFSLYGVVAFYRLEIDDFGGNLIKNGRERLLDG